MQVLVSKALIDSFISHNKFISINNVLIEYNKTKEEIKNLKLLWNILYKNSWYNQKNVWKRWYRYNKR